MSCQVLCFDILKDSICVSEEYAINQQIKCQKQASYLLGSNSEKIKGQNYRDSFFNLFCKAREKII